MLILGKVKRNLVNSLSRLLEISTTTIELIIPHCIPFPSQLQCKLLFHLERFSPGFHGVDMIVEAGAQVPSVLLHNIRRQFMTLFVSVPRSVLLKSFLWCFAGHAHIQTLQHPIELGVGHPKFCIFGKYLSG